MKDRKEKKKGVRKKHKSKHVNGKLDQTVPEDSICKAIIKD